MRTGVTKFEFIFAVSENLPQSSVMKQQPAILIDHQQRCRAEVQNFPELSLVLGRLGSRRNTAMGRRR